MKKIGLLLIGFISFMYAESLGDVQGIEAFWIWIAVFSLGLVGIVILFVSSKQIMTIKDLHKNMIKKQTQIEESQSLFLSKMGENIHTMVEENIIENTSLKTEEMTIVSPDNGEHKLLDITNDLIEFLRLKSKKVEVINENFNLNNVLNEVSGSICSSFKGSNIELIFDIDNSVPRYLVGDSLNLEKILINLLEHTMNQFNNGEVKLEISMFGTYDERVELQFKLIDTGAGVNSETLETLFLPSYDEKNNEYAGLGLFVAKELISIMNGELAVQSTIGRGTTFTLSLPFSIKDLKNKRSYRLPNKILTVKKVFIVDSNYNSALAIKKMFAYFKHDVRVVDKDEYLKNRYNLAAYDMVILDEVLFDDRTITYLNRIKKEQALKVVVLNSLLNKDENNTLNPVIDRSLSKPLNQERIFELIIDMFTAKKLNNKKVPIKVKPEEAINSRLFVHRSPIIDTQNIIQESFNDFRGMNLLIVEDNIINQKVLSNILKYSGIKITIANNGEEAVHLISQNIGEYNVVLMDINMPVMDGYTATRKIRLEKKFDDLPIVAFTALALESEKKKIFKYGMNAFLTKPLELGKLYTVFKMFYKPLLGENKVYKSASSTIRDKDKNNILDIQAGIKYSNNNEAFYIEIIHEFLDAYGQSSELFAKLVQEHRFEQMKMLCIDLKGLTGAIGAKDMHELINEIYQRIIYNKQDLLPNYVSLYEKEFSKLIETIETYLVSK
ncbi:MAG: response regulator [Campylobacterota bacterium]|nr:response regulator [Campylobacterota bacterium]